MNHNVSSALTTAKPPRPATEISAPLNFIRRQDTKPVFHSSALTGGEPKIFFDPETHTVPISDMREIAETLSVDHEGFELLHHTTAVEDLYDNDAVEQVYYREIEAKVNALRTMPLNEMGTLSRLLELLAELQEIVAQKSGELRLAL